jgi:hypothetical protein
MYTPDPDDLDDDWLEEMKELAEQVKPDPNEWERWHKEGQDGRTTMGRKAMGKFWKIIEYCTGTSLTHPDPGVEAALTEVNRLSDTEHYKGRGKDLERALKDAENQIDKWEQRSRD